MASAPPVGTGMWPEAVRLDAARATSLSSAICCRSTCRWARRRLISAISYVGSARESCETSAASGRPSDADDESSAREQAPTRHRPSSASGGSGLILGRLSAASSWRDSTSAERRVTQSMSSRWEPDAKRAGADLWCGCGCCLSVGAEWALGRFLRSGGLGCGAGSTPTLTPPRSSPRRLDSHASMELSRWPLSMGGPSVVPGPLSRIFSPALIKISSSASLSIWVSTPDRICTISSERSERRPYLSVPIEPPPPTPSPSPPRPFFWSRAVSCGCADVSAPPPIEGYGIEARLRPPPGRFSSGEVGMSDAHSDASSPSPSAASASPVAASSLDAPS
mmetsp:Transcript_83563/g.250475  ORF Transcript_83563/g.250475 Transcript_83563/m.250475 type:complete len:336 (-) Transcript_83563:751-1758(-)